MSLFFVKLSIKSRRLQKGRCFVMGLWLNVSQSIVSIILHSITFLIFGSILHRRHRKKVSALVEISPSMTFYFIVQMVTSGAPILYMAFYIIVCFTWTPLQNSYVWFYIFTFQKFAFISQPISVFAIGLDRCFCIAFPLRYKRTIIPVAVAAGIMSGFFLYTVLHIAPMMYPSCVEFTCSKYAGSDIYINIRYFTSALILIVCVILLFIFNKKSQTPFGKNVAGRVCQLLLI